MVGPYVDGELAGSLAERVATHLRRCADCNQEATFIARVKCSLRRLGHGAS